MVVCSLFSTTAYALGLVLMLILIVIGIQVIQFLRTLNVMANRVESLTDIQTWIHFFKSTLFKSKRK